MKKRVAIARGDGSLLGFFSGIIALASMYFIEKSIYLIVISILSFLIYLFFLIRVLSQENSLTYKARFFSGLTFNLLFAFFFCIIVTIIYLYFFVLTYREYDSLSLRI